MANGAFLPSQCAFCRLKFLHFQNNDIKLSYIAGNESIVNKCPTIVYFTGEEFGYIFLKFSHGTNYLKYNCR